MSQKMDMLISVLPQTPPLLPTQTPITTKTPPPSYAYAAPLDDQLAYHYQCQHQYQHQQQQQCNSPAPRAKAKKKDYEYFKRAGISLLKVKNEANSPVNYAVKLMTKVFTKEELLDPLVTVNGK
jgi:hypothetical protein